MTSASAELDTSTEESPQSENYLLHVDILVETDEDGRNGNVPAYEKNVQGAIKVLKNATGSISGDRWRLRLALRADKPFRYDSGISVQERVPTDATNAGLKSGHYYQRYVHLWDIPRPDLAAVMKRIPDERDYAETSVLIAREVQNLLLCMNPLPQTKPEKGAKFAEVRRVCEVGNLGEWIFDSYVAVPALEALNWKHYGLFQTATGRLNVTSEYWQIPPQADQQRETQAGAQAKKGIEGLSFLERALHSSGQPTSGNPEDNWLESLSRDLRRLQTAEYVDSMTVYLPVEK